MKYNVATAKKCYQSNPEVQFLFFWGHHPSKNKEITKSCLSQWWKSDFEAEGIKYNTAEQWMMAKKAELFKDTEALNKILSSEDPKDVKQLGRTIRNFNDTTWDSNKYEIVKQGNLLKFSQNLLLRDFLVATGNSIIVEASPYDNIWGVGLKGDDVRTKNPDTWQGLNLLGFALMEVRDGLI